MNDRNYQVGFCKRCLNRKMDFKQGLLCNITGRKANFEKECPDFKEDISVEIKVDEDKKEQILTPDQVKNKLRADDYEKLRLEQNFLRGITGGIIGGIIGIILWVTITSAIKYQIDYKAISSIASIVVGLIVGFAIRIFGKGVDKIFGISGIIITFLACSIGNFLSLVVLAAIKDNVSYFEFLKNIDMSAFVKVIKEAFNPADLLFYVPAIFSGYIFSFRKITEKDIENLSRK